MPGHPTSALHDARLPTIICGPSVEIDVLREGFEHQWSVSSGPVNSTLATGICSYTPQVFQDFLQCSGIIAEDCAVLVVGEGGRARGSGAALLAVQKDASWCGGLYVAPAYRGQGWAKRLMEQIQRRAVEREASHLQVEVLAWNQRARSFYHQLGYQEQRELLSWERDPRQGPLPLPFERLEEADPAQILQNFYHWHKLAMPWQRRAPTLHRYLEHCSALPDGRASANQIGLTIPAKDGAPVAYALVESRSAERLHILDMAVDPNADLLDAGRPLVQALQLRYLDATLCLVNEPADSHLNRIFASFGFRVTARQYELTLDL